MNRVVVSSQQSPVQKLGDSQMSLFKLVSPSSELELAIRGQLLIPGLPDDAALQCLLRFSLEDHASSKAVCKRWYSIFQSKDHFFTSRKQLKLSDPWLFVLALNKSSRKIEWKVLDLTRFSWHTIPPMPCSDSIPPHGFSCVSVPNEGVLYVCGGVISDADSPLNLVMKYQVLKNCWTVMQKTTISRSFFASGAIAGKVYVAGGNGPDLFELGSGEVFDPTKNSWKPIARMCMNMASYDSAVLGGKLLVTEGWFWPFHARPKGQIYDPSKDQWEIMASGLKEGWIGSSCVIHDHLFVVTEHERPEVKVYDAESDCWRMVEGDGVPEKIRRPYCVSKWGSKIYVVGENLDVAVGNVLRICGEKCRFCVEWEVVDATHPLHFGFIPSNAQLLLA